jgi:hypothetical protein
MQPISLGAFWVANEGGVTGVRTQFYLQLAGDAGKAACPEYAKVREVGLLPVDELIGRFAGREYT